MTQSGRGLCHLDTAVAVVGAPRVEMLGVCVWVWVSRAEEERTACGKWTIGLYCAQQVQGWRTEAYRDRQEGLLWPVMDVDNDDDDHHHHHHDHDDGDDDDEEEEEDDDDDDDDEEEKEEEE
ncbi:LOW QUALITY PROTEIN: hypothetical protein PoB_004997100 [Plakobranchus ocellatus]|uniref:Uncharacterized protein n=1 Tax=Plakobranchus ocellatus TaxID=259542 RepID=A0AAV4BSM9_9GAST|nr:LOW QUALITY PROTEIN: hypothetical protein PoB_004997100 [Plakobranchus ocellatus]